VAAVQLGGSSAGGGEADGTGPGDPGGGSNQIRRSYFGGDGFESIGGAGQGKA
jgi:hypothetical protein